MDPIKLHKEGRKGLATSHREERRGDKKRGISLFLVGKKEISKEDLYLVEIFTLWGMIYLDILFLNVLFLIIW